MSCERSFANECSASAANKHWDEPVAQMPATAGRTMLRHFSRRQRESVEPLLD